MTNEELFMNRRRALDLLGDPGDGHLTEEEMIGGANVDDEDVFGEGDIEAADRLLRLGNNADTLVQKAMLRQHQQRGMQQIAPFARINPVSVLKGTLGGQQIVSSGQAIQVANWAGEDAETLPLTVTFGQVAALGTPQGLAGGGGTGPDRLWRPYGIVQFGTRGFSVSAEIDIGGGAQFTVCASACTLQVALPASIDAGGQTAAQNAVQMKLAGMLSFYPCVRTAPLFRTRYVEDFLIPGGGAISNLIPVPPFSKTVRYIPGGGAAVTLGFVDYDGYLQYQYVVGNTFPTQSTELPLTTDITSIIVTVGAGTPVGRLIFELGL